LHIFTSVDSFQLVKGYLTFSIFSFLEVCAQTMQWPRKCLHMQTLEGLRADLAKWPASAVAHALTTAAVDVTRGLRADLPWSAFHLENAAALGFQQGSVEVVELLR
jgi:hypothetical protein